MRSSFTRASRGSPPLSDRRAGPAFDGLITPNTAEFLGAMQAPMLGEFAGVLDEAGLIAAMDDAGVDRAVVIASRTSGLSGRRVPANLLAALAERWPGRFALVQGVDVTDPETARAEIATAAAAGWAGLHVYPHHMRQPPNRPAFDFLWQLAKDLRLPVIVQCGFSSCPGAVPAVTGPQMIAAIQRQDLDLIRPQLGYFDHPAYLDDVCRRFPEVPIVAAHMGWPWTSDLIWLSRFHPNLHIATSLFYPSTWPTELVDYIGGDGGDKVVWASNYPEVAWQPALEQIAQLGLEPEVEAKLVHGNAARIFGTENSGHA